MLSSKKKAKYVGLTGALLVHVAFIAFLLLVAFKMPEQPEEGGMPVMMGEIPDALGGGKATMTEVDVLPQEAAPTSPEPSEQEMITQTEEETVAVPEKKKEETKKPAKPEKTEAEKAADDMLQSFQGSVKPRYQMAYDDYLYDLQIIAKTGQAPDNEALYNDLRLMRDNQTFVYTKSQEEY